MKGLAKLREKIRQYDFEIAEQLIERSIYPLNEGFYSRRKNHPEFWKDSALSAYIHSTYLPIIREVCEKGESEFRHNCLFWAMDAPLIEGIRQRTCLGRDVAMLKDPKGLPVFVKEIEKRKLEEIGEYAERKGFRKLWGIRGAMQRIMDETKRIEDLTINYMKELNVGERGDPVATYKTGAEDAVGIMELQARDEIGRLERDGNKFSLKTRKDKNVFLVEIHRV